MDVSKYTCTVLFKCLIRGGVNSLAQLQAMSSDEVLRIRGVGKTMVDALEKHNLIKD
jgi:DNA-directed RNA polymerase alpha subunit